MFNKFELIIGALCVVAMASALYLTQRQLDETTTSSVVVEEQVAQAPEAGIIFVDEFGEEITSIEEALAKAVDLQGNLSRMVIDDIKIGNGTAVKEGDTVSVHYAGNLQDGLEFDNSRDRGTPFEFAVGAGQVIKGWEEGLIGMKEGGERILVIPPEKGYGDRGIGPIPGGATLVFKIELLEVK